jgi:hypothetical protein
MGWSTKHVAAAAFACSLGIGVVAAPVMATVPRGQEAPQLPVPAAATPEPLRASPGTAPDWSRLEGVYSRGSAFTSTRLVINADGSAEWHDSGCTHATLYRGHLRSEAGVLHLEVTASVNERNADRAPALAEFDPVIPVKWGDRQYLISAAYFEYFCNAVNTGLEPVQSGQRRSYLLRESDEQHEVEGLPDVPPAWRDRMLPAPVVGHVLSEEEDGSVTIALGRRDGVRAGMNLSVHHQPNSDWAVPQGGAWFYVSRLLVEAVEEATSTAKCSMSISDRAGRALRPGQPVTGRIAEKSLPLSAWRADQSDPRLTFEPLPPVLDVTGEQLAGWTASIRDTFSPGVALAESEEDATYWADALTPAFLNALRGLDMSEAGDVARASAIVAVWQGYLSRAGELRRLTIAVEPWAFPEDNGRGSRAAARITALETFVMWWRDMSADPTRFAAYRRASAK